MGLFSSDKKITTVSSSSQQIDDRDYSQSATGTAGDVYIGGEVTKIDEFPDQIKQAFTDVLNFGGETGKQIGNTFTGLLELTAKTIDANKIIAENSTQYARESVNTIGAIKEAQIAPDLASIRAFLPFAALAGAVVIGVTYFYFRR